MKKKNSFLVKFTVAAAMIGLFSPSVSIQPTLQSSNGVSPSLPLAFNVSLFHKVEARRGGGGARRGGGGMRRGGARSRPSRSMNRNRNINRNRNVNRNINRNVNVNRRYHGGHGRYYGGYGRGYGYYGGAPVLAFATGMAIGSIIAASTMPRTCTTVVTNGISYRRCDNTYYQPFYQGDTLVYKSVSSPY